MRMEITQGSVADKRSHERREKPDGQTNEKRREGAQERGKVKTEYTRKKRKSRKAEK